MDFFWFIIDGFRKNLRAFRSFLAPYEAKI